MNEFEARELLRELRVERDLADPRTCLQIIEDFAKRSVGDEVELVEGAQQPIINVSISRRELHG